MNSFRIPKVILGINSYTGKNGERCEYLEPMLDSVVKTTHYPNYEIVVYDDCSPHKTIETICNKFHDSLKIKYIRGQEPRVRWHKIRNSLTKECMSIGADYYSLFDDDYEFVVDNWMNHVVACMENIPEIGILGCHWARLEDGITRQTQHSPVGKITKGQYEVFLNKYVTGGCWTIKHRVLEEVGLYPEDGSVTYDAGNPGADTYYGWKMMECTNFKLCTTTIDLAMHRGQKFMRGIYANKYNSKEFQDGKRLY